MRLTMRARMVLTHKPQSGDACGCNGCVGYLRVANSYVVESTRIRLLACNLCRWRPADNKILVPLQYAPRRSHC